MIKDEDGNFIKITPNAIPEETSIMLIFAMA